MLISNSGYLKPGLGDKFTFLIETNKYLKMKLKILSFIRRD